MVKEIFKKSVNFEGNDDNNNFTLFKRKQTKNNNLRVVANSQLCTIHRALKSSNSTMQNYLVRGILKILPFNQM